HEDRRDDRPGDLERGVVAGADLLVSVSVTPGEVEDQPGDQHPEEDAEVVDVVHQRIHLTCEGGCSRWIQKIAHTQSALLDPAGPPPHHRQKATDRDDDDAAPDRARALRAPARLTVTVEADADTQPFLQRPSD